MRVVSAETLYDTIIILIDSHKRVAAAKSDLAAAQERANMTVGEWFPTLGVTANYGYEYQRKGQGSADTSLPPRNVELSLSQLLWDWGATNSTIHRAQLEVEQSKLSLRSARQSVILEAISGYLEVLRQTRIVAFAKGSVANIKHQADLEDSKVVKVK